MCVCVCVCMCVKARRERERERERERDWVCLARIDLQAGQVILQRPSYRLPEHYRFAKLRHMAGHYLALLVVAAQST